MPLNTYWGTAVSYTLVTLVILVKSWSLRDLYENKNRPFIIMMCSMLLFSLQDLLWAFCYDGIINNERVFFVVSQLFHFWWAITVFCWLYYILDYLGAGRITRTILLTIQGAFVLLGLIMVLYNTKEPLLFSIENGQYIAVSHRWYTFLSQYYVYILTGAYALFLLVFNKGKRLHRLRSRYVAICCASVFPVLLGVATIHYTDVPFYSLGFLFSCFVLYVFVVASDYEELRKKKSLFLRGMSHELRTPLNAMYGFAQLLGMPDGTWTDKERERYNTYINNSYSMIDMLINDLMVSVELGTQQYHVKKHEVEVASVCNNTMSLVQLCKPTDVNMQVLIDLPEHFIIESDYRRIEQVLFNLLTNACRYTQNGKILLHAALHKDELQLVVSNTSKPVPVEEAENIFDPTTPIGERVQNLGLKLTVCRKVAELLGGRIYLDTTYTEGCRFVLALKVPQQHRKR